MRRATVTCGLVLSSSQAIAAAPFLTEDPAPVESRQSEFYVFSTYNGASESLAPSGLSAEELT